MIKAYQKILEMESVAELKLEQDKKALEKIRNIMYQEKDSILDKLIIYLKRELDIDYFKYEFVDINDNIVDILVKKDSKIFMDNIEGKDFINLNAEELIDSRMFDNKDEIIIADLNCDGNLLNLGYICDSLSYNFLSYSDEIKDKLATFANYVINKYLFSLWVVKQKSFI